LRTAGHDKAHVQRTSPEFSGTAAAAIATCRNARPPTLERLRIVSNTGTVSLRRGGFSLNASGIQFIPSMSRTRKATHRTREFTVGMFRRSSPFPVF
jgi:hypothetical protein